MGKSKKVKLLLYIFLTLIPILFLTYIFLTPQISEKQLKDQFKQIGLQVQAEKWDSSFFRKNFTLKNVLLTHPDNIEYPLLQAERLFLSSSPKKIVLLNPKIVFNSFEKDLLPWKKILNYLLSEKVFIEINNGTIEGWADQTFTGVPFQFKAIELKGRPNDLKISTTLVDGFSSLISFAPSARLFQNEDYFFSTRIQFQSFQSFKCFDFKWSNPKEILFTCQSVERNQSHLYLEKPILKVEHTHANRWKLNQFSLASLQKLSHEIFKTTPPAISQISAHEATLYFADKYVFPLFKEILKPVDLSINLKPTDSNWSLSGQIKDSSGSIELQGDRLQPMAQAQFKNISLEKLHPYYYQYLSYQKITGGISGELINAHLKINIKNFKGMGLKQEDPLEKATGLSTPLLLSLLQDKTGIITLEIPFQSDWIKPFAHQTILTLSQNLRQYAEIKLKENQIDSISWYPITFEAGKEALTPRSMKTLLKITQWLSLSENLVLTLQPNQPTLSFATDFSEWNIQTDSKGYKYIVTSEKKALSQKENSIEVLRKKRVQKFIQALLKNKKIRPQQIKTLPPTDQELDAFSYSINSEGMF